MKDSRLSAKLVSLFLVFSVCLLGYTAMSTWGAPTPTAGKVAIDESVEIYQSANVRVYFTAGGDIYLDKLTVTSDYVQVNESTEIGVQSTIACNLNLTSYNPVSEKTAGVVAEFSLYSTGVWVPFTFYIGNLKAYHWYNIFIDGVLGPSLLTASGNGVIGFSYAGAAGQHDFEVQQFALAPPIPSLLNLIVVVLVLGIVASIAGEATYMLHKQKTMPADQMMKSLIKMVIITIIGLGMIGLIVTMLAGG